MVVGGASVVSMASGVLSVVVSGLVLAGFAGEEPEELAVSGAGAGPGRSPVQEERTVERIRMAVTESRSGFMGQDGKIVVRWKMIRRFVLRLP